MRQAYAALPTSVQRTVESLVLLIIVVLLWQLATSASHHLYFPTPQKIWVDLLAKWFSAQALKTAILPSLIRIAIAWVLAAVVGILLGTFIGLSERASGFLTPLIHFGRAVPPPAALPIFLIFFGIGNSMKVLFIAFGVVWPILINTMKGVQTIDPILLESATVYRIFGVRRLFQIIFPAASPEIFAGLRISLALGFVLMVISEMISASGGIGFEILQSQSNFDIVNMWAGMVVLGVGGILFSLCFALIEGFFLKWQKGMTGQTS